MFISASKFQGRDTNSGDIVCWEKAAHILYLNVFYYMYSYITRLMSGREFFFFFCYFVVKLAKFDNHKTLSHIGNNSDCFLRAAFGLSLFQLCTQ